MTDATAGATLSTAGTTLDLRLAAPGEINTGAGANVPGAGLNGGTLHLRVLVKIIGEHD